MEIAFNIAHKIIKIIGGKIAAAYYKGIIIGIANIIPGVSGGTMALILGIYERLISAIHNISGLTFKKFFLLFTLSKKSRTDFSDEFKRIDGLFLILILSGALSALIIFAKIMTRLLNKYHDPTYGFFFGLVLISVIVPFKLIKKKTLPVFCALLIAIAGILLISNAMDNTDLIKNAKLKYELKQNKATFNNVNPVKNSRAKEYILLFLASAVAITAMILPGISGSFMLLLMGQYFVFLRAFKELDFMLLFFFASGALFGLLSFTRFLNWLLKKHYDTTMGFLSGLVIGSLWVVWPFKNFTIVGDKRINLNNILPLNFGSNEFAVLATFIFGIIIVLLMINIEKKYSAKKGPANE